MKHWIKQLFTSPEFENDLEKNYRALLLNSLAIVGLVYIALAITINLLDRRIPVMVSVLNVVIALFTILFRVWVHQGKLNRAGMGWIVIGYIILTLLCINLGTIRTPTTSAYIGIVVLAGMLYGQPGIILATIASSLAVMGLILAENAGLLPAPNYTVGLIQWFTFTYTFGITGGMVSLAINTIQQSLRRAEMEVKERQKTEVELRKLTQAVEQSPASVVITNLEGNIEYVNPTFTKLTGYQFDEALGNNPRILKTDATPTGTHVELWKTIKAGKEWRGEFANRKKDGSIYYESAMISVIKDENGNATHYLAVKEDITQRKKAEAALRESEARYRLLADYSGDVIWTMSMDGKITYVSPSVFQMRGFTPEEALQQSLEQIVCPGSLGTLKDRINTAFSEIKSGEINFGRRGQDEYLEIEQPRKNGTTLWAETTADVMYSGAGTPVGIVFVSRDMSERKRLKEELFKQATTDSLTGLFNRRFFIQLVNIELNRTSRSKQPLTLVLLDIDHFKQINDSYGHAAGDQSLIHFAKICQENIREIDVISRFGGDEFVLLFPDATSAQAFEVLERIHRGLATRPLFNDKNEFTISISAGLSTLVGEDMSFDAWLEHADRALYQAKNSGRNRTVIAGAS